MPQIDVRDPADPQVGSGQDRRVVAYVMSRFPKVTETFVLYEILEVERLGLHVEIFPLFRERQSVIHTDAEPLISRAHYLPFLSGAILRSQVRALGSCPRRYVGALAQLIGDTLGSRRYLLGGLAIFPKAVHAGLVMKELGVTHIHCHFSSHPATAGYIIHRLTGIPFSFTAHGSDVHVDRHMLCTKLRAASFAVTVSDYNRAVIREECSADAEVDIGLLRSGVDTAIFAPPAEGSRGGASFDIICVGTLHEVKGQAILLDACALLDRAGVRFTCTFVGDGPDLAALTERSRKLDLGGRVRFVGAKQRDQIVELLQQSDVLVTPSVPASDGKREGIPVVLMEAMSTQLPVVASRLTGIPELVKDGVTGLLVEPGDRAGLSRALEALHRQPALRIRLGTAARDHVLAEHDLRTNARRLVERIDAARRR